MALNKIIKLDNGIELTYHRITYIQNVINVHTLIEVGSYINEEERNKELQYKILQSKYISESLTDDELNIINKGLNTFINTKRYVIPYKKEMNVDESYEYLKTLEEFEEAEDI